MVGAKIFKAQSQGSEEEDETEDLCKRFVIYLFIF
jgi:hypothetical protein